MAGKSIITWLTGVPGKLLKELRNTGFVVHDNQPERVELEDDDEVVEAPGEEVGDDELVLGPDKSVKDMVNPAVLPLGVDTSWTTGTPFAQKLHMIIQPLASWTKGRDIRYLEEDHGPMSIGYWVLLDCLSIENLVVRFLAGISQDIQDVFEKSSRWLKIFSPFPP
ncbi:hypothetical protein BJX64DRAFT_288416 [Aspergillus heterothallicus]